MTKFLKKGIKFNGQYFPVRYAKGPFKTLPEGTITVHILKYKTLPSEAVKDVNLGFENNSDIMTDYFENDKLRIFPGSKYYNDVVKVAG